MDEDENVNEDENTILKTDCVDLKTDYDDQALVAAAALQYFFRAR